MMGMLGLAYTSYPSLNGLLIIPWLNHHTMTTCRQSSQLGLHYAPDGEGDGER
jgi:hypothetical protein